MKYSLPILFALLLLGSCRNATEESKEITQNVLQQVDQDCRLYWEKRFPADSTKVKLLKEIISSGKLTDDNKEFLLALKEENENENEDALAFEKVLAPIFRKSETEIGIFSFNFYKNINDKLISASAEMELIESSGINITGAEEHYGETQFYPGVLDSVFKDGAKPGLYYYTPGKIDSTRVLEIGSYVGECLEYFEYSIDTTNISARDSLLFSSPLKIDLVSENNARVDSLIEDDYWAECQDCPNSKAFQRSFARLKGTDNMYFIFADTFPLNNELDTPSRALILVTEENEIIYLWYEELDLFGCSCL